MKNIIFALSLLILITIKPSFAQAEAPLSLYDRLGGVYAVSAVVDDFVEKLLTDPVINANKNVTSALGKINKAGLRYHLTEMVCSVTGGPQKYTGRPMKESHAHLNISEGEWGAMLKDFLASLKKFNVPEKEQNELVSIIATTKPDIVTTKPVAEETIPEAFPEAQAAPAPAPPKPAPPKPHEGHIAIPQPPSPPAIPEAPALPGLPELPQVQ